MTTEEEIHNKDASGNNASHPREDPNVDITKSLSTVDNTQIQLLNTRGKRRIDQIETDKDPINKRSKHPSEVQAATLTRQPTYEQLGVFFDSAVINGGQEIGAGTEASIHATKSVSGEDMVVKV